MPNKKKILGTLKKNKDLHFVDRILNPSKYPTLDLGKGTKASHLMSWGELGKERTPIVYPEVLHDPGSKHLIRLSRKKAREHAEQSGNYIKFDTPEEADSFSKNYKLGFGLFEKKKKGKK